MVKKRYAGVLTCVFFLTIAGYVFYETGTSFAKAGTASGNALTNAALYPRIIAFIIFFLSICHIVKLVLENRKESRILQSNEKAEENEKKEVFKDQMIAFGCFIWLCVYIALLETLGYLIATPIMMIGLLGALGVRKPLVNLAYSIGGTTGIYAFFQEFLDVVLPIGLTSFWFN